MFKVCIKLKKLNKVSLKKLNNFEHEKESLVAKLSELLVLVDSLKSENTMLINTIDALENKLEKFSSDNLKSMLCIHSDISKKPALIIDDMSTSTSHASNSELGSIDIKSVIVDTACLENSCLNNCVKPKCKDTGTQAHGKFVPTCLNCGKVGHIRPNCFLLKSH